MIAMLENFSLFPVWQPGLVLLLAAVVAIATPRTFNNWLIPTAALAALVVWLQVYPNTEWGETANKAASTFALAFIIISFLAGLYAFDQARKLEQVATLLYAGSTISVIYSPDYLTFFIFWEITAISSTFIVWSGNLRGTFGAGLRYLAFQLVSGVLLLMGIVGFYQATGSLLPQPMSLETWYGWCFLVAFGIKAAFPFLHMWLPDAYPNSSATGSVVLSAFTTKMAIFALLLHFQSQPILILIGLGMAIWPMLYMTLENDIRRVIAYALQNQFGFMVVAIGVGSKLAVNGAVAHAFACTFYGGLLYMASGALLHNVGTTKCHELGQLAKRYPFVLIATVVGGFTIAAFPFFIGFASKSLTLSALAKEHYTVSWLILVISSIAVIDALAFKVPYHAFFKPQPTVANDRAHRETPAMMKVAIGLTTAICILPGIFPHLYYQLLPYEQYHQYALNTIPHLITQYQLIVFTLLGFLLFNWLKLYPNQYEQTMVDAGVLYRKWLPMLSGKIRYGLSSLNKWVRESRMMNSAQQLLENSEKAMLAHFWPTGSMVIWVAVILVATLLLYFI